MQPNRPLTVLPQDLQEKILRHLARASVPDPISGCINYTGWKNPKGYGRYQVVTPYVRRKIRIHRAVWIIAYGPIQDEMLVVDHLCGNRGCVNPLHLELITNEENLHRGDDRYGRPRRRFT